MLNGPRWGGGQSVRNPSANISASFAKTNDVPNFCPYLRSCQIVTWRACLLCAETELYATRISLRGCSYSILNPPVNPIACRPKVGVSNRVPGSILSPHSVPIQTGCSAYKREARKPPLVVVGIVVKDCYVLHHI
jgi:hypothetical protein